MNDKVKKILWFSLSFALSFGSFIGLHICYNWSLGYNGIYGFFVAVLYIPVCMLLYQISRKDNISLARGFIWGLVSILIFFFTIGGCGIVRF